MAMKGAMSSYYHEARAQVKKIKTMTEENKKRAERRAEIMTPHTRDPLQQLFVAGSSCQIARGGEAHAANESGANLVPWNGDSNNMIDRFDVRALLDFYREPDARVIAARQKTQEEQKLEEILRFESYRDLVKLLARGISEERGLVVVQADVLERRARQEAVLQAANEALYASARPTQPPPASLPSTTPAGTGTYSAVGFSYGGGDSSSAPIPVTGGFSDDSSDDSDEDDSDEDDSDDDDEGGGAGEAELAQEVEDDRVDDIAQAFGLQDFAYRLHKVQDKEGEEEARMRPRPRKHKCRVRARARARRMAGMGLDHKTGLPLHELPQHGDGTALVNPWQEEGPQKSSARGRASSPFRPYVRRASPDYGSGRRALRDGSSSPGRAGRRQYITEFVGAEGGGAGAGDAGHLGRAHGGSGGIIDALPGRPDPAMPGAILPVKSGTLAVQGVRHGDLHKRLLRQAAEDDEDDDTPHAAAGPTLRRPHSPSPGRRGNRSRSRGRRSRSRSRGRRSRSRSRGRRSRSRSRGRRSRSRSRGRRSRSRSRGRRSRSRSRGRDRDRRISFRANRRSSSRDRGQRQPARSRSRSRERDHREQHPSHGRVGRHGSDTRRDGASHTQVPAASGRAPAAAAAAAAAAVAQPAATPKESAQERLKRLMQAQLNKAAQKDSLASAQKRIQEEKDRVARQQIERIALATGRHERSPSPAMDWPPPPPASAGRNHR